MSDCLWESIVSIHAPRIGFFDTKYQEIEDISRLEQATKNLRNLIEKVDEDLKVIEEKIQDNYETIIHISNQLPETTQASQKSYPETNESKILKDLFNHYRLVVSAYPTAEDFTKMSERDLEIFNEQYEVHHDLVCEIAGNLLAQLDFEVKRFQTRFEALPRSLTLSKK